MTSNRESEPKRSRSRRPPATTPEARERQMVSKAVALAERQLENGTASAQVITHYLKLGSSREHLEQERLRHEVELMKIKGDTLKAQQRIEDVYVEALAAMKKYSTGHSEDDDYYVED